MIRDFWVKNYLSIRDKQGLDFVAKGPASELVSEVIPGVFLYKLGILYGSNASGKSNMLAALNTVFDLLAFPQIETTLKIEKYEPFALTKDEPSEMHVSFYANGIRYDYDVKFNDKYILNEALFYYPNKTKALFYERRFVGDNVQADIKFGSTLNLIIKTQNSICENTLNNHSVLSVCQKVAFKEDAAPFSNLHHWIIVNYHDVDGDENNDIVNILKNNHVDILKNAYNNTKKRKFYNLMLQKADLNIMQYRPIIDYPIPMVIMKKNKIRFENMDDRPQESVAFENHSANGSFEIPLKWQSKGTLKYIKILDALYDLITGPHVYLLDELGEDLHNDLLYYYLNVFIFNSDKSQLIITSQETTLLSQDLINENRGVVWFVDKNKETASSEYARGDSFGLHKNLSLYNSYRIGRLGAKPELGSIFIDLED